MAGEVPIHLIDATEYHCNLPRDVMDRLQDETEDNLFCEFKNRFSMRQVHKVRFKYFLLKNGGTNYAR